MTHTTIDSPIGELTLVARDGALSGVYMPEHRPAPDPAGFGDRDDAVFADAVRQLAEYWAGDREAFELPLDPAGSPFQLRVWDALREIPYGETRSYAQVAAAAGSPRAVRAVGTACRRNPLPVAIPCHRVVRSDGALGQYVGGVEAKQRLLRIEGAGVAH